MASKTGQEALSTKELEELVDTVDSTMDRLKTLYEQYFLGIQKQAPAHLHTDVERKLRDLTQMNIRNTGLRYRLATLQQKFGSYNSYWRRTLRQIENGTYARNLAKIGRDAIRTGADIPEEILAAMPKRMREQIVRDRDQALAIAKRRNLVDDAELAGDDAAPAPSAARKDAKTQSGAHILGDDDADLDFDKLFSAFEDDGEQTDANIAIPPKRTVRAQSEHDDPFASAPASRRNRAETEQSEPAFEPPEQPAYESLLRTSHAAHRDSAPAITPPPAAHHTPAPPPRQSAPALTPPPAAPHHAPAPPQRQSAPAMTPPVAHHTPPPYQARGPRAETAQDDPYDSPSQRFPQVGTQPGVHGAVPSSSIGPSIRPANTPSAGPSVRFGVSPSTQPGVQPARAPTPAPVADPGRTPGPPGPGSSGSMPQVPAPAGALPRVPTPAPSGGLPRVPAPGASGSLPRVPAPGSPAAPPPSQQVRPNPIAPGSASAAGPVPVESMNGPFPRQHKRADTEPNAAPVRPTPRPQPRAQTPPPTGGFRPPPGMTEADVNALHAKYVQAKQMVGEKVDASSREKLLRTIQQTAPKIMEQYKSAGVDFSVVVKDNQVVIKAKPKG